MTPKEVLAQIRQREVTTVDLRFMDFPGVWQHFSIPADALTEETFEEGIGFDGSSVVGWRAINEADLTGKVALVLGSEGEGLRRLTRERCDVMVRIPMVGESDSLNLAIATAVLLYEVFNQRRET